MIQKAGKLMERFKGFVSKQRGAFAARELGNIIGPQWGSTVPRPSYIGRRMSPARKIFRKVTRKTWHPWIGRGIRAGMIGGIGYGVYRSGRGLFRSIYQSDYPVASQGGGPGFGSWSNKGMNRNDLGTDGLVQALHRTRRRR